MMRAAVMALPLIAVLVGQATEGELSFEARFPALKNEEIVVRNDDGLRNEDSSFSFGDTCYTDPHLQTWFVVKRIVADRVLVELECTAKVFGNSCPNGTESSKSLVETLARVDAYTRETDNQFMEQFRTYKPIRPH
jgi:hypothetical protein